MRILRRLWLTAAAAALSGLPALAQTPPPAAPATKPAVTPAATPAPAPAGVAAHVNGQPVTEAAVSRGLERWPPEKRPAVRPELVAYLVDNLLLDQYLLQINVAIDKKAVDAKVEEIKAELKKINQTLEKKLAEVKMSDAEFREQLTNELRWEKHVSSLATEKALRELFDANKEMFDRSTVRARHILVTGTEAAATTKLQKIKADLDAKVNAGLAKLPANADKLAREKERVRLLEEAFSEAARTQSECPSKSQGGDIGWFPRAGYMVEPFAKAAFALKPYEMSGIVKTQFGYHLIMPVERKAGADVKFEQAKEEVKEVFGDRLRESILAPMRVKSKITIYPAPAVPAATTTPAAAPVPIPKPAPAPAPKP
jgi:peptidyl-prolyl cis-trans isomerase C